jgi:phosphatidylglycerophosphatase A
MTAGSGIDTLVAPVRRPTAGFLWRHPARWFALGFGAGLSPRAPGTVGTLWAWVAFLALDGWLDDAGWGLLIAGSALLGVWACARTAADLGLDDPGAIVWDEVVAFWLVLWLVTPAGLAAQALAFALFRFFDAVKPGPVGWADRLFPRRAGRRAGWAQGVGIMFDDLVAAGCTLLLWALAVALWGAR